MRTYLCVDCPLESCEHTAGARGPLPRRCPEHRRQRELRRERRRRSPLRVVQPDEQPPAPPAVEDVDQADEQAPAAAAGGVREALQADLAGVFSKHPAARTLERVADVLAAILDSPIAVIADPKIVPPLSRELRAIVKDLTEHKAAEEDDLFGGAGPVAVGG